MRKADGLEYEVQGEGEPVLLIHGSHIADSFLPFLREPLLADRYRLIRYRRRGFGGSERAPEGFGIPQQAEDARRLAQHLGVERAHVVGHSYGGVIAAQLASEAPGLVHSLALLEPAIMAPEASAAFFEGAAPIFAAYEAGDAGRAVDLFMEAIACPRWRRIADAVPGGPEQAERDAATFFEVEALALQAWSFDAERARRVAQPLLYVIGEESGPLFESAMAHFQALIPRAEPARVAGVDHLLQMRDAKGVAAPIAAFLARHPL